MLGALLLSGCLRSLQFTSLGAISYADIAPEAFQLAFNRGRGGIRELGAVVPAPAGGRQARAGRPRRGYVSAPSR